MGAGDEIITQNTISNDRLTDCNHRVLSTQTYSIAIPPDHQTTTAIPMPGEAGTSSMYADGFLACRLKQGYSSPPLVRLIGAVMAASSDRGRPEVTCSQLQPSRSDDRHRE